MEIISKYNLVNGQYYEGIINESSRPVVAKWNEADDCFEYAIHHWSGTILAKLTYWDDFQEYLESFFPVESVDPKSYELVENL